MHKFCACLGHSPFCDSFFLGYLLLFNPISHMPFLLCVPWFHWYRHTYTDTDTRQNNYSDTNTDISRIKYTDTDTAQTSIPKAKPIPKYRSQPSWMFPNWTTFLEFFQEQEVGLTWFLLHPTRQLLIQVMSTFIVYLCQKNVQKVVKKSNFGYIQHIFDVFSRLSNRIELIPFASCQATSGLDAQISSTRLHMILSSCIVMWKNTSICTSKTLFCGNQKSPN